jgi:prevent-host-death family protein
MQVNMLEAKSRLSNLIVAAERGEEVLIARNGVPVARIVPYVSPPVKPPGAWKGLVPYSTDWRSAETDREIQRLFCGEDDAPAA